MHRIINGLIRFPKLTLVCCFTVLGLLVVNHYNSKAHDQLQENAAGATEQFDEKGWPVEARATTANTEVESVQFTVRPRFSVGATN